MKQANIFGLDARNRYNCIMRDPERSRDKLWVYKRLVVLSHISRLCIQMYLGPLFISYCIHKFGAYNGPRQNVYMYHVHINLSRIASKRIWVRYLYHIVYINLVHITDPDKLCPCITYTLIYLQLHPKCIFYHLVTLFFNLKRHVSRTHV